MEPNHAGTRRRRRRLVALAGVALAGMLATSAFVLADDGVSTLTITPPPGLAADGTIADVQTSGLTPTFTHTQGRSAKTGGTVVARILHAKNYSNNMRFEMSWLNSYEGHGVLFSPNAQLHVGLYYPNWQGSCDAAGAGSNLDNTQGNIVDNFDGGAAETFCAKLDSSATGSIVGDDGRIILHESNNVGFALPTIDGSSATSPCPTSDPSNPAMCRPTGVSADKNIYWVVVTIVNPGGNVPPGAQNTNGLQFYMKATAVSS